MAYNRFKNMFKEIPIAFNSDDLTLEGVITESSAGSAPGILICSPEPHLGGSMDSVICKRVINACAAEGFVTLRFNYRGVGSSEGQSTLGQGEIVDSQSALEVLRDWPSVDEKKIIVLGYSYGAGISVRLAISNPQHLKAIIPISPHLNIPPLGLSLVKELNDVSLPISIISGQNDLSSPPNELNSWIDSLQNDYFKSTILPDGDHSWRDAEDKLCETVVEQIWEYLKD